MKIAITGANGFVGNTIINHFAESGNEAIALIRKSASLPSGNYQIRTLDYEDPIALRAAIEDVDVLVHNAGKTVAFNHMDMIRVNLGLTRKIVAALNSVTKPIHLVYISSQAAAGPSPKGVYLNEDAEPHPLTSYGKSKLLAEKMIRRECRQAYTIVRPCSVYGPGDKDFLNLFKLCSYGFSTQIGREERPLNMIHVRQLAAFLLLVSGNPQAHGEIFFATDNQVYTQAEIAECICRVMGKRLQRIVIPEALARPAFQASDLLGRLRHKAGIINNEKYREITAEAWVADPAKARSILGWNPEPQMEQLIMETYQWYVQASWL
ncbi:MAG TPA: NAD(P)-dependent oxidoreductase [Candidatus Cloacimonadota bacterium]|nr:NAD(P)-dependent oxidoreductase [Candidatus Cloacimonadota bacterium]